MKNFKGYTLLETVIAMALITIIISMVYFTYSYFTKNVYEFSKMTSEDINVTMFYDRLKEEFYMSDNVIVENTNSFIISFYDEKQIAYSYDQIFLYRRYHNSTDSIRISDVLIHRLDDHESKIQSILIKAVLYEKEVPLYVFKKYYTDSNPIFSE